MSNRATFGKRLLAIFYDSLIIFFLTIVVTLIIQQLVIQLGLVSLEDVKISATETIQVIPTDSIANSVLKSFWLITSFAYFYYYWTSRGQTLGMKVWKIKLESTSSTPITDSQVLKRYIFAFLGLGLLLMIFDRDKLALQDKMSQTIVIKK